MIADRFATGVVRLAAWAPWEQVKEHAARVYPGWRALDEGNHDVSNGFLVATNNMPRAADGEWVWEFLMEKVDAGA